jgi:DNA-binding XRE family transcriptional regulator
MSIQIIEKNGQPEWAVIPYEEYLRLLELAEMQRDIRDFDAAYQAVQQGEELVPGEVTFAILDGASPIRAWRTYRGYTQRQLAEAAGISKPYLSQLESGKRTGTAEVLSAIARALGLKLDDLLD